MGENPLSIINHDHSNGFVQKFLWFYQQLYAFAKFSKPDLQEYRRYKMALIAIKVQFHLKDFGIKQIDKLLLRVSKKLGL